MAVGWEALVVPLVTNTSIALVLLLLFSILRRRHPGVYKVKRERSLQAASNHAGVNHPRFSTLHRSQPLTLHLC